jgi:hypothetical protein
MRFFLGSLLLMGASVVCAQTLAKNADGLADGMGSEADLARSRVALEKLRQLVDAGAAPRVELERAEEALSDAADFAILRKTLYGDLTESEIDEMLAAAGRRLDRRKQAVERVKKLVDAGVVGEVSVGTYMEALDWAQKEYDLAVTRARQVHDLAQMASIEQNLQQKLDEEPLAAHPLAERFDGDGVFTTTDFQKVEQAYTLRFSKPLPLSAVGETAVHRALGFDHRGRVDVALNPDQPEGKWLREYLQAHNIPFFAFWQAVPGKATGAHIHIGPMSTRLAAGG